MAKMSCEQFREWLALGESEAAAGMQQHLAGCGGCRQEAARLGAILHQLTSEAEVQPSPGVDRRIRSLLSEPSVALQPFLRPLPAAGLGVAAFLALFFAVAMGLAEAGAAERGPIVALFVVTTYLAFNVAAALPLLLLRRSRLAAGRSGVGP